MRLRPPSPDALHKRLLVTSRRMGMFWPLAAGFVSLCLVFLAGVAGYMLVEGWNFLDSFFMVVITLSTVGYGQVHPLSDQGVILTSILIMGGVGSFAYLVGAFTQLIVEGRLQTFLGRRRVQRIIDGLSGHVIICGYGRIGNVVAKEIIREGIPVVVIERSPDLVARMEEEGVPHVIGDATEDAALMAAGLTRARTIVTALTQDSANVFVALTARQLNPGIQIIARAETEAHIPRLERAGANKVLMPHVIGGYRMAQSVLRPAVTDFLDLALLSESMELQMEELRVTAAGELVGRDLVGAQIRPRFDLIIIAIKKADGEMLFNPTPHAILEADDTLIAVGRPENLNQIRKIL